MVMEWIKADEEPPIDEIRYVVWTSEGYWASAVWFDESWAFTLDAMNCRDVYVTHWLKISPPEALS
jgi:hypothetical protein